MSRFPRLEDRPPKSVEPDLRRYLEQAARHGNELSGISRIHQFAATPAAAEMTTNELGYYALTASVVLFIANAGTTFAVTLVRT